MELITTNNTPDIVNELLPLNKAYDLIDLSTNAESTKDKYKSNVVHFVQFVNRYGLTDKSLLNFRIWLDNQIIKQDGKGLISDRTKNGYIAAATHLIKQAIHYDMIGKVNTDVTGFKLEKGHKTGLTLEEVQQVKAVINAIDKKTKRLKLNAMFHLLAFRGLRQMELQSIRIENIDFKDNTIRFRRKGQRKQYTLDATGNTIEDYAKYKAYKCFPLVMDVLKAYVDHIGKAKGFLFYGRDNKTRKADIEKPMKLVSIRKVFTENAEGKTLGLFPLAGIPSRKSTHGTRHFFGTYLIDRGYSPAQVADLLGHKTLDMVMVYYDSNEGSKIMDKLEQDFKF